MMEHSNIAKLRYITMAYRNGSFWATEPEEDVQLKHIENTFGSYLFKNARDVPLDIINELSPTIDKLLKDVHWHDDKNGPRTEDDHGWIDMAISMCEIAW